MTNSELWQPTDYQLCDFGDGRKLERFGAVLLDRPCPAAERKRPQAATMWRSDVVRLGSDDKSQVAQRTLPNPWQITFDRVTFDLRLTPFGHVGLFPEHAVNWRWLSEWGRRTARPSNAAPLRALNLFAYTGGASLCLAAHGWHVVHVDASAPSVAWARLNAQLSRLDTAPIRWIVDDARAFVARELRRGQRYDAIVLDPPSYGHGPKGKAWQIDRDLDPLLADCARLLTSESGCLVLTGHSPELNGEAIELARVFSQADRPTAQVESGRLTLADASGRPLDCGWYARAELI